MIAPAAGNVVGTTAAEGFASWPALREHLASETAGDGARSFELDGPGTLPALRFDARISRIGKPGQTAGSVLVLRDITQRTRIAQEHLNLLSEQAARRQAEAASVAKDRFLATVSHELRSPLTPVLANVTAMLDEPPLDESAISILEMMHRNILLEVRLIDDLLDVSRIRHGSFDLRCELVDAHALVRNVIAICGDDCQRAGVTTDLDLSAAPSRCQCRRDPLPAGSLECDQERDQVHSRGRPDFGPVARRSSPVMISAATRFS